jgi:DNA-binding NarL/FixJ family response regulator
MSQSTAFADTQEPGQTDSTTTTTTILVVDDHRSFADMLAAALDTISGMKCVATAASAAEGIALAALHRPTIVIMDIQMPGQDGLMAARRIREVAPETLIAVVTAHRDQEWITRAAQAGACAFIPKNGSLVEMIDVLRRVRFGQLLVAPSAYRSGPMAPRPTTEAAPALTGRELDVLNYLGQGMPARGIARVLGISVHTCRGYLKSVHAKLGVSSQLEAVIKAKRLGLIDPPGMTSAG